VDVKEVAEGIDSEKLNPLENRIDQVTCKTAPLASISKFIIGITLSIPLH
jgi:hypothetical protein